MSRVEKDRRKREARSLITLAAALGNDPKPPFRQVDNALPEESELVQKSKIRKAKVKREIKRLKRLTFEEYVEEINDEFERLGIHDANYDPECWRDFYNDRHLGISPKDVVSEEISCWGE